MSGPELACSHVERSPRSADAMIQYTSPIEGLFAQISAARPTSISCPPNIWAGLYAKFVSMRNSLIEEGQSFEASTHAARQHIIDMFGGKLNNVATGGAPTPQLHLDFATEVLPSLHSRLFITVVHRCVTLLDALL